MDQKDREVALSQMTSYDSFGAALTETRIDGQQYLAVVCVPPKVSGDKEKWVGVYPSHSTFNPDIRQPDEGRVALCANQITGHSDAVCYWYTDELPCCIVFLIVMAVVLSVLTTPLTLLCLVPMIYRMNKVNSSTR